MDLKNSRKSKSFLWNTKNFYYAGITDVTNITFIGIYFALNSTDLLKGENNDRFDRGPAFPILPELVTS